MATIDQDYLQSLVNNPQESLAVELKRWIDPRSPEGIAAIAKCCIAMRNNNGGYLVIGFDNDTGQPDTTNTLADVRSQFHIDVIQNIVAKYASIPFEVEVFFLKRSDLEQEFPVICVASGVKTPVASKSRIETGQHPLIVEDRVYVRSLNSNNTPSTTQARWNDWERLTAICFDNREADIGRFIRRHLSDLDLGKIASIVAAFVGTEGVRPEKQSPSADYAVVVSSFLDESKNRFETLGAERDLSFPPHGSWEVAFLIEGGIKEFSANNEFLNLIAASNPKLTGWPLWIDSRGLRVKGAKPFVHAGIWEALIVSLESSLSPHIDFWRCHPKGRFYHRRALEDDIPRNQRYPTPLTLFDFAIATYRVAEALAVGISLIHSMGCTSGDCLLHFCFRWKGLKDRQLASWADPSRDIWSEKFAYQDEIISNVVLSADTPGSSLFLKVHEVTKPLYELFDGFELSPKVSEELTNKLLNRKW